MSEHPRRAPDYTTAFLVTTGGILFMAFFTIAALAGFAWVLLTALGIDQLVRLIGLRRGGDDVGRGHRG